ncbi:MAG: L-seryl-tRNA(Sec) selenium transferase [Planctomyces sp.]|nr:L-seryl-tRNA(Sec) selenium transferase [Planctomyces sp.]
MISLADQLRLLPSADEVLRRPELKVMPGSGIRVQLVAWIRQAVDECRDKVRDGVVFTADELMKRVIGRVNELARLDAGRMSCSVINATGVVLHTNLGRAPLAERAVRRIEEAAGYVNVEMNLETGKRNARSERVVELLCLLTGAEDAVIVNNCAAATMMTLQVMAAGREVIVSRGQLVEIGGGYRLPEVFEVSGARLREVGTTNRTYLHDYEDAINDHTGGIIRVHRSNFSLSGFVTEPSSAELADLCRRRSVPLIDDLGSGCIQDLVEFGLVEPTVSASVSAGADVVLMSGDKLFGGPQAGIILGRRQWISAMRKSPLMRALRADKLILAALEATLEVHLSQNPMEELPLLQMLTRQSSRIRSSCERVVSLVRIPENINIGIEACESEVGGGSIPGSRLPSFAIRIAGTNPSEFSQKLRRCRPAVVGRIQDDGVLLDLRTVSDAQIPHLAEQLQSVFDGEAV